MQQLFNFDNSYARLPERFHAKLDPTPVSKPKLIKLNIELADQLGLDSRNLTSDAGIQVLAGNQTAEGSQPLAMAYAGQQFGHWTPQLGDGRALLLGEMLDVEGVRFDIQLKGSGPTPFSRMGDGRAWLGPVLREYVVSEAMHSLGVPTTRALAAVATGESVLREQVFPGAVLTRVARSHVRVGTFQYFAARQDEEALRLLTDYVIDRLHPAAREADNPALGLLEAVMAAQAKLIAAWMSFGFIHGVMNTDNVSVSGETIDYGPCAFMDAFHPDKVFSSIDEMGRYAYSNQPRVAHWNLVQFAQSLLPLLGEDEQQAVESAQNALDAFPDIFKIANQAAFNAKLGLSSSNEGDESLVNDLLGLMANQSSDFTLTFRALSDVDSGPFLQLFANNAGAGDWYKRWLERLAQEKGGEEDCRKLMKSVNPAFIPRNHRVEEAIRAALEEDFEPFERLTKTLKCPFEEQPENADLMLGPEPQEVVRHTFCGT